MLEMKVLNKSVTHQSHRKVIDITNYKLMHFADGTHIDIWIARRHSIRTPHT